MLALIFLGLVPQVSPHSTWGYRYSAASQLKTCTSAEARGLLSAARVAG